MGVEVEDSEAIAELYGVVRRKLSTTENAEAKLMNFSRCTGRRQFPEHGRRPVLVSATIVTVACREGQEYSPFSMAGALAVIGYAFDSAAQLKEVEVEETDSIRVGPTAICRRLA